MDSSRSCDAEPSPQRRAPALLTDFFTDFFTALPDTVFLAGIFDDFAGPDLLRVDFLTVGFLAADFLGADFLVAGFFAAGFVGADFFAAVLLGASFTGAFFAAGCVPALSGFRVASLEDSSSGDFVTDSIAAPTADLIDPAMSSAIASP